MLSETETLRSVCGQDLHLRIWKPAAGSSSRGALILMHGLGGHCGRFRHVAAHFTNNGYTVYGPDMVGFGESGGRRGHTPAGIETHAADLLQCLEKAQADGTQGKNTILFGHSMGGLTVLYALLDRTLRVNHAIVNGPAINSGRQSTGVRMMAARMLVGLLPAMTMNHGIDVRKICSDPQIVQRYRNDPLVHNQISIRLALSIIDKGADLRERAAELGPNCSLLLLNGEDDQIASPRDTRTFGERVGCQRSEVRIFADMKHEVWNEPDRDRFFQEVDSFIGD